MCAQPIPILRRGLCVPTPLIVHGFVNDREMALPLVPEATTIGTPASFEEFFAAERATLFRALLLVTHDTWEADEILQDAFCKVWERWDVVRNMDNPTGYLFRTAMNAHRSAYRRTVRAAKRAVAPPPASDPFEEVAARDDAVRALAQLTPRQRAAVVVTEVLGYPSAQAAHILKIRPGTVRMLVSQARQALTSEEFLDG
jgi:RNA polymerase sigma-70 factor, ECF subfamily